MSDTRLGQFLQFLPPGDDRRDAIHIAVICVTASVDLEPGQHVGCVDPQEPTVVGPSQHPVGIIDPFLETGPRRGQQCYMLLYPYTITSLKHHWTHPAFPLRNERSGSEQWLRDLAAEIGITYDRLMAAIPTGWIHTGANEYYGARDGADIAWHYAAVTGKTVSDQIYFSCAC